MRFNLKTALFFILATTVQQVMSQDMSSFAYRTQHADLVLTCVVSDTALVLTNKHVDILLNYDNAKFTMLIDRSKFFTANDTLNKILSKLEGLPLLEFKGKLGIDYVNTQTTAPVEFEVDGVLSTTNNTIVGTGYLEHISTKGAFADLLSLSFIIDKDELGLSFEGYDIKDEIEIEVVETILNRLEDK